MKTHYKKSLVILLAVLLMVLPVSGRPLIADDETSTEAGVQVLPAEAISYGAKVAGSQGVFYPTSALM